MVLPAGAAPPSLSWLDPPSQHPAGSYLPTPSPSPDLPAPRPPPSPPGRPPRKALSPVLPSPFTASSRLNAPLTAPAKADGAFAALQAEGAKHHGSLMGLGVAVADHRPDEWGFSTRTTGSDDRLDGLRGTTRSGSVGRLRAARDAAAAPAGSAGVSASVRTAVNHYEYIQTRQPERAAFASAPVGSGAVRPETLDSLGEWQMERAFSELMAEVQMSDLGHESSEESAVVGDELAPQEPVTIRTKPVVTPLSVEKRDEAQREPTAVARPDAGLGSPFASPALAPSDRSPGAALGLGFNGFSLSPGFSLSSPSCPLAASVALSPTSTSPNGAAAALTPAPHAPLLGARHKDSAASTPGTNHFSALPPSLPSSGTGSSYAVNPRTGVPNSQPLTLDKRMRMPAASGSGPAFGSSPAPPSSSASAPGDHAGQRRPALALQTRSGVGAFSTPGLGRGPPRSSSLKSNLSLASSYSGGGVSPASRGMKKSPSAHSEVSVSVALVAAVAEETAWPSPPERTARLPSAPAPIPPVAPKEGSPVSVKAARRRSASVASPQGISQSPSYRRFVAAIREEDRREQNKAFAAILAKGRGGPTRPDPSAPAGPPRAAALAFPAVGSEARSKSSDVPRPPPLRQPASYDREPPSPQPPGSRGTPEPSRQRKASLTLKLPKLLSKKRKDEHVPPLPVSPLASAAPSPALPPTPGLVASFPDAPPSSGGGGAPPPPLPPKTVKKKKSFGERIARRLSLSNLKGEQGPDLSDGPLSPPVASPLPGGIGGGGSSLGSGSGSAPAAGGSSSSSSAALGSASPSTDSSRSDPSSPRAGSSGDRAPRAPKLPDILPLEATQITWGSLGFSAPERDQDQDQDQELPAARSRQRTDGHWPTVLPVGALALGSPPTTALPAPTPSWDRGRRGEAPLAADRTSPRAVSPLTDLPPPPPIPAAAATTAGPTTAPPSPKEGAWWSGPAASAPRSLGVAALPHPHPHPRREEAEAEASDAGRSSRQTTTSGTRSSDSSKERKAGWESPPTEDPGDHHHRRHDLPDARRKSRGSRGAGAHGRGSDSESAAEAEAEASEKDAAGDSEPDESDADSDDVPLAALHPEALAVQKQLQADRAKRHAKRRARDAAREEAKRAAMAKAEAMRRAEAKVRAQREAERERERERARVEAERAAAKAAAAAAAAATAAALESAKAAATAVDDRDDDRPLGLIKRQRAMTNPPLKNPFAVQPEDLAKRLHPVHRDRTRTRTRTRSRSSSQSSTARSTIGHALLPQTDASVQVRKQSAGALEPLSPFIQQSVLTMDDAPPLPAPSSSASAPMSRAASQPQQAAKPAASLSRKATARNHLDLSVHAAPPPRAPPHPAQLTRKPTQKAQQAPAAPSSPTLPGGGSLLLQRVAVGDQSRTVMLEIDESTKPKHILRMVHAKGELKSEASASGEWGVFEVWRELGLERPIREVETIASVVATWTSNSDNTYLLAKRAPLSSIAIADRPVTSGIHGGHLWCELKPGKWSKRYVVLRDNTIYLCANEKGRDEVFLCTLSSFDVFQVPPAAHAQVKAPRAFAFGIKSLDKLSFFETKTDFAHYFCTKDEAVGLEWIRRIYDARTFVVLRNQRSAEQASEAAGRGARPAGPPPHPSAAAAAAVAGSSTLAIRQGTLLAEDAARAFRQGTLLGERDAQALAPSTALPPSTLSAAGAAKAAAAAVVAAVPPAGGPPPSSRAEAAAAAKTLLTFEEGQQFGGMLLERARTLKQPGGAGAAPGLGRSRTVDTRPRRP